jgi:hypothetical protein
MQSALAKYEIHVMPSQAKVVCLLIIAMAGLFLFSCSYVNHGKIDYTSDGNYERTYAQPSIAIMERIIEFREKYNVWPASKEEFTAKDPRYRAAFEGFPYLSTTFKIVDFDNMIFYFKENVKNIENYEKNGVKDVISYRGYVKFYKEEGKFIWKMKIQ